MARMCRLELQTERRVRCPEDACPFWEPGGAVLDGRCAFDHLDLDGRRDVAEELLGIRRLLEVAATEVEQHDMRRPFYRRLSGAE